jgi:hypothetical protein
MKHNFNRNVDETEQHLLHHFLGAGTFVHCTKWLVGLTPNFEKYKQLLEYQNYLLLRDICWSKL